MDTLHSYRVLETSHPPVFYFASRDVACQLEVSGRRSFCEWKGEADYLDVVSGDVVARRAAWTYPDPSPGFEDIAGYIAFYPSLMDACTLDGVRVKAQVGDFYGGWITPDVVGPFKGAEGTFGW